MRRRDALLEARRISGSGKPRWGPSPLIVLAHKRQAGDFAVIDVKPVLATPRPYPGQTRLEVVAVP
jgi:hypothetical protein